MTLHIILSVIILLCIISCILHYCDKKWIEAWEGGYKKKYTSGFWAKNFYAIYWLHYVAIVIYKYIFDMTIFLHILLGIITLVLIASGLLHYMLMSWLYGWGFDPKHITDWWSKHLRGIFWTHVIIIICLVYLNIFCI